MHSFMKSFQIMELWEVCFFSGGRGVDFWENWDFFFGGGGKGVVIFLKVKGWIIWFVTILMLRCYIIIEHQSAKHWKWR